MLWSLPRPKLGIGRACPWSYPIMLPSLGCCRQWWTQLSTPPWRMPVRRRTRCRSCICGWTSPLSCWVLPPHPSTPRSDGTWACPIWGQSCDPYSRPTQQRSDWCRPFSIAMVAVSPHSSCRSVEWHRQLRTPIPSCAVWHRSSSVSPEEFRTAAVWHTRFPYLVSQPPTAHARPGRTGREMLW